MAAPAEKAKSVIEVVNPATLEKIADIPVTSDEDLRAAVDRAREAQEDWARRPLESRIAALRRLRDVLVDRKDEVAETIAHETGKPPYEAMAIEIVYTCNVIDYYSKIATDLLRADWRSPLGTAFRSKRIQVGYSPHGVVGFITPWNFPFMFSCGDIVPALIAGNGAVLKPSEFTPLSALLAEKLFAEALPEDLVTVVPGFGHSGASLIPLVDYVAFTGSVATGKKVMAKAAETLTPVSLELGGKDPMIVLADADLNRAAAAAVWGGLFNAGQACISIERVYVESSVADAFVRRVVSEVGKLRQGPAEFGPVDVGSMTNFKQLQIVESHVEDAVKKGAKVQIGGRRNPRFPGYFYEPTVLTEVTHEMKIMTEETFGPVIPIMEVEDCEEAIAMANDSRYGLGAAVFAGDTREALRIAREIRSGAVCINDCCFNYIVPDIPFGGVGESGIGFRHSPGGLTKFCRQQAILEDRLGLKHEPGWFPYTTGKQQLFRRIIPLLYRSGWRKKLGG